MADAEARSGGLPRAGAVAVRGHDRPRAGASPATCSICTKRGFTLDLRPAAAIRACGRGTDGAARILPPHLDFRSTCLKSWLGPKVGPSEVKAKSYHVIRNPAGGWSVREVGAARATRTFDTQAKAVSYARGLARQAGTESVRRMEPTAGFAKRNTDGRDPYPPKGANRPADEFRANVFVNCPFDDRYQPLLRAIIFCILDLGFEPRIALERLDSGETRLTKIVEPNSRLEVRHPRPIPAQGGKKGRVLPPQHALGAGDSTSAAASSRPEGGPTSVA